MRKATGENNLYVFAPFGSLCHTDRVPIEAVGKFSCRPAAGLSVPWPGRTPLPHEIGITVCSLTPGAILSLAAENVWRQATVSIRPPAGMGSGF